MAKPYLEKLSKLIQELRIEDEVGQLVEAKHFFSGAALYVNGAVCASGSPTGLAFKLPVKEVEKLIGSGEAIPLKYFPKGHVKKGYALFENPDNSKPSRWKRYFVAATREVQCIQHITR